MPGDGPQADERAIDVSNDSDVTDEQIMAARDEAREQGIQDPFMARVSDYGNDLNALRDADAEAERNNMEAWRAVLRAALGERGAGK